MGRLARIVLVLVALALVFAPRALAPTTHDGPRVLTAAVLAPSTGDADAVAPAREAGPTLTWAVLVAALALVLPARRRWLATAQVGAPAAGPSDPRPRRRGPPRSFA